MTIIGAPHFGHSPRALGALLSDMSCTACGAETKQMKAKWQECGAPAVGEESEVPDAHEPFGE